MKKGELYPILKERFDRDFDEWYLNSHRNPVKPGPTLDVPDDFDDWLARANGWWDFAD